MKTGPRKCKACGHEGHFTATCREMTGQTFGSWTVLRMSSRSADSCTALCRCVCGTEKDVWVGHLRKGMSRSCGCQRVALVGAAKIAEGTAPDPARRVPFLGEMLSLGEIADAVGKRPDQIWRKMRLGMSAEEAAFGRSDAVMVRRVVDLVHVAPADDPPPSGVVTAAAAPPMLVARVTSLESEVAALRAVVDEMRARVAS